MEESLKDGHVQWISVQQIARVGFTITLISRHLRIHQKNSRFHLILWGFDLQDAALWLCECRASRSTPSQKKVAIDCFSKAIPGYLYHQ
jgi:hypothetical protein